LSASPNPYEPPPFVDPAIDLESAVQPRRPIGVAVLSLLHVLGGLAIGGLIAFLAISQSWRSESPATFPPMWIVITAGGVLAALGIACGIGMWVGTKWSWWLAAFYYVSMSMSESLRVLVFLPIKWSSLDEEDIQVDFAVHGVRATIFLLLAAYIFKGNVRRFFDLGTLSKLKAIAILVAITLALAFAFAIVLFLIMFQQRSAR